MANSIKVKRSATPSAIPTTVQLELGELAINTYDGKVFIKKDNGTASVIEIGAGSGTVTSVAALTLGTTGTDLSSTVANSTTTPVITLQVPTASATTRGALSSTDWSTFNNKGSGTVTSVTGTAPVASSGGTTPAISMAAATTSVNGYLTSTDWTTFNNKGSGTITAVSVATANGVSGSSSGGATPALTIALGSITPSAVQVSGLTASQILSTDASKNLTSLAVATYPSLTELAYVKGVTSAIQTQINAKGAGTVTSASVVSANGFAGTVATATSTPAITLTTSITGVLKGNATAISAATSGTDYSLGTSALATGIVKSTTTTGALTIAIAADFPTLNQNTTGNASTVTTNANLTGGVTSVGNAATVITNANLTGGVTSVGNAATVVTNANLTGDVTSSGNATTLTNASVIAKVLTGYVSGAGTVAATDSILQAIQKLNGNANSGTVTSVAATVPSVLSITGSPITTSGTLAITYSGTALPVANGGTSLTTLTANNVILGNGASAPTFVAPSTSGNLLTSNGTTWASTAPAASTISLSNDTTTATNVYPTFASATTGTTSTVYTSNAKLLYKPSTGELSVTAPIASNGLVLNATTVATSYTIAAGYNASSVGPVTISSGVAVTITSGQRWLVL